ncbi:MAG: adenylate/guanylate cyclase domain-containing protein [Bacteriovoracaceae bacterium]|nr:adenylate/guanylate cyclase domain-containing protein [Bacteriovoracaceae bacterium]
MHSKTLTILFADIQGYTKRTSRQSREQNQNFITEINDFIKKYTKEFSGIFVKNLGDGFLLTFESPTNAVNCGKRIQKEIKTRNANILKKENYVQFRIGISTGEVSLDENGDVFGDAVNIASRIETFAEPNEVFISESTYLAMNKVEVYTQDLGPQQFKNVLTEVRVYKVLTEHEQSSNGKMQEKIKAKGLHVLLLVFFSLIVIGAPISFYYFFKSKPQSKADPVHKWNSKIFRQILQLERKLDRFKEAERHLFGPRNVQLSWDDSLWEKSTRQIENDIRVLESILE